MKVALATEDMAYTPAGKLTPGGSCWWRVVLPARRLEADGWDVTVGKAAGRHTDPRIGVVPIRNGQLDVEADAHVDVDVVVLHRCMFGTLAPAIRRARQAGQVVVADVDDWYFGLRTSNVAFASTHKTADAESNVEHYRKVLTSVDLITCSTPWLAERLGRYAPTVVVRNAIDIDRWAVVRDARERRQREGPPTVGWVGAVPWRSNDLEQLKGIVGPWLERSGWGWYHGGHVPNWPTAAELAGVPEAVPQRTASMLPIGRYPWLWYPLDVALIPLNPTPFSWSAKSNCKPLEAVAAGVPFIAAASDENRWLHDTHGIGRIGKRPKDWLRHLDALSDPEVRAKEAADNLSRVHPVTMDGYGARWSEVLGEAVNSR